jgi:hypothetical protein
MRGALKGRSEFAAVKFLEFGLQKDLSGRTSYVLVAVAPNFDVHEALRVLVREKINKTAGQDISCPNVAPIRELKLLE